MQACGMQESQSDYGQEVRVECSIVYQMTIGLRDRELSVILLYRAHHLLARSLLEPLRSFHTRLEMIVMVVKPVL